MFDPAQSGPSLYGEVCGDNGNYGMDNEATVPTQDKPPRHEQDWAEAEWFQTWLRLARREYQGKQPRPDLKQAA